MNEARFFEYLKSLDWSVGTTKHEQTHKAALRGADLGIPAELVRSSVTKMIEEHEGILKSADIDRQIRRAYEHIQERCDIADSGIPPGPKPKLEFNRTAADKAISRCSIPDLRAFLASRSKLDPATVTSSQFLNQLYRPGENVLVFTNLHSQGQVLWQRNHPEASNLPTWGVEGVHFLINPVDGKYHPNPRENGKTSRRSEESITSWRYMLMESDLLTQDEWLRILVQLPLRITSIATSGGKSVHALLRVDAASKAEFDEARSQVEQSLVPLGADRQALAAVHTSRLPQSFRGDSRQELLFLDPEPDMTPLKDRAECCPAGHNPQGNQTKTHNYGIKQPVRCPSEVRFGSWRRATGNINHQPSAEAVVAEGPSSSVVDRP